MSVDAAVAARIAGILRDQANELMSESGADVPDAMIRQLAESFCDMDDDQQAKFFVEVARIMNAWGGAKLYTQAYYIGRHLRTCACSTDDARELVRLIADATTGEAS